MCFDPRSRFVVRATGTTTNVSLREGVVCGLDPLSELNVYVTGLDQSDAMRGEYLRIRSGTVYIRVSFATRSRDDFAF